MLRISRIFTMMAITLAAATLDLVRRLQDDPVIGPLLASVTAAIVAVKAELILVPSWFGFAQLSQAQTELAYAGVERSRAIRYRDRLLATAA